MFQNAEQYFKGLSDMGQRFFNVSGQDQSWAGGLEKLMQATGFAGADQHEALFDRLMNQSKAYLSMLEKFAQAGQGGDFSKMDFSKVDFSHLGQQWLQDMAKQNPFMQSGAMPNMPNMPNFSFDQLNPQAMFQHVLNMPAFGYNRESQERQTELLKHLATYQQTMQRYNELSAQSVQKAIENMQGKLALRSEPGRELDSLKAVYDLWIDALEESFAEMAMSDAYQKAYGNLVDAQMRLRGNVQKQIELATGNVGMPTRTELEGVHQKLAEVRRQLRNLSGDSVDELRAEVATLRAEMAALKSGKSTVSKASEVANASMAKAKSFANSLINKAKTAASKSVAAKPASKAPAAKTPIAQKPAAKKTIAKGKPAPAANRKPAKRVS